jgi:hypothetical protein
VEPEQSVRVEARLKVRPSLIRSTRLKTPTPVHLLVLVSGFEPPLMVSTLGEVPVALVEMALIAEATPLVIATVVVPMVPTSLLVIWVTVVP